MSKVLHQRKVGLDIIRAVAILLVLLAHSLEYSGLIQTEILSYQLGVAGVELFFVLSGYLIGRIILQLPAPGGHLSFAALKNFWIRRWYRTIPIYILALFIHAAILFLCRNYYVVLLNPMYFLYFVFLQNSFIPEPGLYGIAWSLSVEEWFYISFPLFLFVISRLIRLNNYRQILFIILYILLITGIRIWYVYEPVADYDLLVRKRMPFRLDSIIWGVTIAWLSLNYTQLFRKYSSLLAVAGLILVAAGIYVLFCWQSSTTHHLSFFNRVFLFNYYDLGLALCLPIMVRVKTISSPLLFRSITITSLISYSMYLLHIPVINLCSSITEKGLLLFSMIWVLTFVCSYLSYTFIEKPVLMLRDKRSRKEIY